jgi:hypothetical protein
VALTTGLDGLLLGPLSVAESDGDLISMDHNSLHPLSDQRPFLRTMDVMDKLSWHVVGVKPPAQLSENQRFKIALEGAMRAPGLLDPGRAPVA